MFSTHFRLRRLPAIIPALLLVAGFANAQGRDRAPAQDYHRFSLSMAGGYGFSEGHRGLLDLQTEFQFGLTRRLRLGLGAGYMKDHAGHGMEPGRNDRRGAMPMFNDNSFMRMENNGLTARVVPLSLNLYYGLPIGRKWTVFMSGGGSYYFGSFERTADGQHKRAWGGQAGLGLEYRIAQSLQLVAEAAYRFVEFTGLTLPAVNPPNPMQMLQGFMASMFRGDRTGMNSVADYLKGAIVPLAPKPVRPVDLNLSGLSLRMGVKFGL
jgi:hypothetical protein